MKKVCLFIKEVMPLSRMRLQAQTWHQVILSILEIKEILVIQTIQVTLEGILGTLMEIQ